MSNHLFFVSPGVAASRCFPHVTHQMNSKLETWAWKWLWCQDVPSIQQLELCADLSAKEHVSPSVQVIGSETQRSKLSPRRKSVEFQWVSLWFTMFDHGFIIFHPVHSCSFMKPPIATTATDAKRSSCDSTWFRNRRRGIVGHFAVRIAPADRTDRMFYGVLPPSCGNSLKVHRWDSMGM